MLGEERLQATRFLSFFDGMKESRVKGRCKYPLNEVILLGVAAVSADCDGFSDIAQYGADSIDSLRRFAPFAKGVPKARQLANIIAEMDHPGLALGFAAWRRSEGIIEDSDEEQAAGTGTFAVAEQDLEWESSARIRIGNDVAEVPWTLAFAIDGQAQRGSRRKSPHDACIMVTAFDVRRKQPLAHVPVEEKSNEITAIPRLLELLADTNGKLVGAVVTMDAMGAQREICRDIIDREGDYVISLKGNQGTLHEDVKLFFDEQKGRGYADTSASHYSHTSKGHGRIATRSVTVLRDNDWLQERHNWPGLKSIVMVESVRQTIRVATDRDREDQVVAAQVAARARIGSADAAVPAPAVPAIKVKAGRTDVCKTTVVGKKKVGRPRKVKADKPETETKSVVSYLPDGRVMTTVSETRFFISSLLVSAMLMYVLVLGHWAIENCLHWVMDMVFHADASRVRTRDAPANFATIRQISYSLIRRKSYRPPSRGRAMSMRQCRKRASRVPGYAECLLM